LTSSPEAKGAAKQKKIDEAKAEEKNEKELKVFQSMVTSDTSDIDDGSEDDKKPTAVPKKVEPSHLGTKPTILMTGATHARELISTNFNVYQMLKLLRLGEIEKNDDYKKLLQ